MDETHDIQNSQNFSETRQFSVPENVRDGILSAEFCSNLSTSSASTVEIFTRELLVEEFMLPGYDLIPFHHRSRGAT